MRSSAQAPGRLGWEGVLLVAFGALCAGGMLGSGFYVLSSWGPLTLVFLGVVFALAVARQSLPARRALVAVSALAALAAWAWLSRGWGESADAALQDASRLALYAAMLGALCLVLRGEVHALLLMGVVAAGALGLGLYVIVRMLGVDGPELFLYGRLNEPLGYVNGQAAFFLIGLWPALALAEREHPLHAGAGAAGAALLGALLVLCQSRGMTLGLLVTIALMLAAVPGRARRAWALLVIGASVAIAAPALLDVYDEVNGEARLPVEDTVRHAAAGVVLAAVLAGAVWGTATGMVGFLAARGGSATARLRTASIAGLAVVAVTALVIGAARAGSLAERVGDQYDSFVKLGEDRRVGDARFLSGGGNRYDYWRIALREFRDEPLRGVGAGNYDVGYFRERRTTENVHQPHSLGLQVLAELGLVGGGLLALFAGAVLAGLIGLVRRARDEEWARAMAVAAGGAFVAWLVQTEVDWLQLLPAITGVALAAAAVALRPWEVPESRRPASPGLRAAALGALAAALAIVAVGVARPVRADRLVTEGQDALRKDPVKARAKADDALKLNPDSLPAYYLKASAHARGNDYLLARATLLEAARREPGDWVTWALLGDLASRRGDRRLALRYYRRGLALNPRDPELARLIGRAR